MQAERVPQGQQKHMSFSSFTQKLSEIYGCRYEDGDKRCRNISRNRKIKAALAVSRNVHLVSSSLVPRRSEEEFGKNAISWNVSPVQNALSASYKVSSLKHQISPFSSPISIHFWQRVPKSKKKWYWPNCGCRVSWKMIFTWGSFHCWCWHLDK